MPRPNSAKEKRRSGFLQRRKGLGKEKAIPDGKFIRIRMEGGLGEKDNEIERSFRNRDISQQKKYLKKGSRGRGKYS